MQFFAHFARILILDLIYIRRAECQLPYCPLCCLQTPLALRPDKPKWVPHSPTSFPTLMPDGEFDLAFVFSKL